MKYIEYWKYLFLALFIVFIVDACAKKKVKDPEQEVISWTLQAIYYDKAVLLLSEEPMYFFEKEVKIKFLMENGTHSEETVGNIQDANKQIIRIFDNPNMQITRILSVETASKKIVFNPPLLIESTPIDIQEIEDLQQQVQGDALYITLPKDFQVRSTAVLVQYTKEKKTYWIAGRIVDTELVLPEVVSVKYIFGSQTILNRNNYIKAELKGLQTQDGAELLQASRLADFSVYFFNEKTNADLTDLAEQMQPVVSGKYYKGGMIKRPLVKKKGVNLFELDLATWKDFADGTMTIFLDGIPMAEFEKAQYQIFDVADFKAIIN